MKEQATPRPWRRGRGSQSEFIESQIHGQPLQRVASIYYGTLSPEERNANAALIVTAVNSHEALVEALNDFVLAVDVEYGDEPMPESFERAYRRASAALAKTEA